MSTTTRCDQCEKPVSNPGNQITVANLCPPLGIMVARDFDFCGPDCFWAWTRTWPVPQANNPAPEPMPALRFCPRCGDGFPLHEIPSGDCLICDHCHMPQSKP